MAPKPILGQQQQQQQNRQSQIPKPSPPLRSSIFRPWESTEQRGNVNQLLQLNREPFRLSSPNASSSFVPDPSLAFTIPSYRNSPNSPLIRDEVPPSKTKDSERICLATSDQSSLLIAASFASPSPVGKHRRVGRRLFAPAITAKLDAWFHSHVQHPYPSEEELRLLSFDCGGGISIRQIRKWISNKRDRTKNTRTYNHCPHPMSTKQQQQRRKMDGSTEGHAASSSSSSSASSTVSSSASATETDSGVTSSEVETNSIVRQLD